ncbi:PaaI family thioesterase [Nonomuraea sp. MCN248]|uniref:Acyl-coenzyme A thioesterase THEM4 n=1 Tax=Nonomuraea corallina TaxID=2989783 RepID=A0ABT4SLR3_9ACTN|nr:PaaI family thioesterase [Nonomuraea corallina]MDA0638129.1 PaaI family thioesterase [Nonomuraea corallina]
MTLEAPSASTYTALLALVAQTRALMDAVVATGADDEEIAAVTEELRALTERLDAVRRPPAEVGEPRWLMGNAVVGAANPFAPPIEIEYLPGGGVRAEQVFRPLHEGPPGLVHGGVSAMVLDHLLGTALGAVGRGGLTASLTMTYRAPVPFGTPVVATAEYTRSEGRKSWADGRMALPDGTVLVEATGLFITPSWFPGEL